MSDNNIMENDVGPASLFTGKKLYYTISEVSRITGLKDSVLRSWDREFPQLRPKRSSSGVRSYKAKDIELVLYIKRLLHEEKYTISGAKQRITEERRAERLNSGKHENPLPDDNQYQYEEHENKRPPAPMPENQSARSSPQNVPAEQLDLPLSVPAPRHSKLLSDIRSEIVEILNILKS